MSWRENGQKEIKILVRTAKLAVMYAGGHDVSGWAAPLSLSSQGKRRFVSGADERG